MLNEIKEIAKEIKIIDLPELLHKQLWEYKAEGRANIVVAYRGKDVKYNGVVLRVRKITLEEYKIQQSKLRIISVDSNNKSIENLSKDTNNNNDNNDYENDIDVIVESINGNDIRSYNATDKLQIYNLLYNELIINNFFGKRFSGINVLLKLNPTFLENLNRHIYPSRPENRRSVDRIDDEQFYGTLSLDYTKVRRTQTFIPASLITTSLDLNDLDAFDNEPLSNIENSLHNSIDEVSLKDFNDEIIHPDNTDNENNLQYSSSNIETKSTTSNALNQQSSTINVQVATILGLESKLLFAEPIENTESSESESLSFSKSNILHNSNSCDDIPHLIDDLNDEVIVINQQKQESSVPPVPIDAKIKPNSTSNYPKSHMSKNKFIKKESHSNSFILRPIEHHPLLNEKSQVEINKILIQQHSISSKLESSDSQTNNNTNFSLLIQNQNISSLNQYEIAIPEAQSIAIELKPKWGFKPNPKTSKLSKPKSLIKYKYCRFCLHYLFKNREKIVKDAALDVHEVYPLLKNHFCPLDLYSGNEKRVRKAIDNLYNHPGNNLKLFINGKQIDLKTLNKKDKSKKEQDKKDVKEEILLNVDKEKKDHSTTKKDKDKKEMETLIDNLSEFFNCDKNDIKQIFCDFFTQLILQESELFDRLKFHQRHLDNLDIENIIQFYDSLIKKEYKLDENSLSNKKEMKEPTVKDWFYGFKKYKEKIKSVPFVTKFTNFKPSEIKSLEKDNNKDKKGLSVKNIEEYTDEEKIQCILEFLISKTLKDCSILIAVQSIENPNSLDGSISINSPLLMTQSSSTSLPSTRKTFINSHLENLNKKIVNNIKKSNSIEKELKSQTSIPLLQTSIPLSDSNEDKKDNELNLDRNKENYREITINNRKYRYNVHIVDLDSKSIKKIHDYYKLDQDIVECYDDYNKSYGECREIECIDSFDN